jgi:molybdopterin converting factor small subunit
MLGLTPRVVLKEIIKENPNLYDAILVAGELRPHVRQLVAGRDIELSQGQDPPIKEDDELAIFPPIAGG